jgi:hypothetical protein
MMSNRVSVHLDNPNKTDLVLKVTNFLNGLHGSSICLYFGYTELIGLAAEEMHIRNTKAIKTLEICKT